MVPQTVVNDSNGGMARNGTVVGIANSEVSGGRGEQRPNAVQMMQVIKL